MTSIDPRRPVIVGVGQHTQRTDHGEPELEPAALFAAAARRALEDAEASISGVGSVRLVRSLSSLGYRNAPLLAASIAGFDADEYVVVEGGGETPGAALIAACDAIKKGEHESVLLLAGEAWYSQTRAQRAGATLAITAQSDDEPPPTAHGSLIEFVHPVERSLGIVRPIQQYPMFEQALRVHEGRDLASHQAHLGRLAALASDAAQANPYAWDRQPHAAEEIATPSADNRMVGFPYTKLMVSNEQVDMAAALLVTSAAWAEAHGIARDKWVFPLAAAKGEASPISERFSLHDSVLVREVGRAVEAVSGLRCADASYVDLYSCFPSAVQVQAAELGLDVHRPLSLTGGMRFSGGPWCGYAMHGFAATVGALREDPGSLGLVTGNGGAITKLVVTLLSTEPSPEFRHASAQASVDAAPRRTLAVGHVGAATIESATVMHGRGGIPEYGIVAARLPDERRAWGIVHDESQVASMTETDVIGHAVDLCDDGSAILR
jgi:acetyl-CoA C-acetyltransferase